MQANIMNAQRTQPYDMADDEMWKWRRVWTYHDTQRMQLPSAHVQWPALQYIAVQSVRGAVQTFSWKTATGPTRIHPRPF
eukprot:5795043-Pyramimonas_sp.AAC.1